MGDAWNNLDLGGGGLQTVNRRLAALLRVAAFFFGQPFLAGFVLAARAAFASCDLVHIESPQSATGRQIIRIVV